MSENKKVKTYYCDKLFGKDICGERDPSKFETGRFSTCKKCRNKRNTDYYRLKKNEEKDTKMNSMDTDYKIRTIVEDCILRTPCIDGYSVKDKFGTLDQTDSDIIVTVERKFDNFENIVRKDVSELLMKFQKENMELRKEITEIQFQLKKEIQFLKSKLL